MKENKGIKEVKGLVRGEIENKKGVVKMEKERKEIENEKGGCKMKEKEGIKEVKELVKEVEERKRLLVETVFKWSQSLNPIRDIHVKIRGRYYPLLGKDGKLYVIDKVEGKKVPFDTLDKSLKYVIICVLAERKEEIEKEVQEDKRKYLEKKLEAIDELLKKF